MARLVVITKGAPAASHELGASWVTIGRADGNTFQILAESISGRHCEVKLRGDELVVRDLQSTNGTFVAGKKISEAVLKAGEAVRVGEVELRFENSPASPSVPFVTKMLATQAGPSVVSQALASATANTTLMSKTPAAETEPSVPGGPKKFQVLFVDDSLAFLETFGELCLMLSGQTWQLHTATTADKALAILNDAPMDLVVLDIGIPMVDGIQLLGIISRRYPGLKIAVMTGRPTEGNRAVCLANGAELFLEKPVSPEDTKVAFNLLNDLATWHHREGFSGALRQVGLQEVVQMECIGRHSSILEVRNTRMRGEIYIDAGVVVHATAGDLAGEQAFAQLCSFKGGEFQLKPFKAPPQRTVHTAWELLLMEAARVADEETDFLTRQAGLKQTAGPAPAAGHKKE